MEYQPIWANPFVYLLFKNGKPFEGGTPIKDGHLVDVHRLVFASFKHLPKHDTAFKWGMVRPGGTAEGCTVPFSGVAA